MAELRIPIITEFKGKKAFKEANTATSTLQKGVKKLGAQLAITFGATQLLKFAKNAAKAFIEDDKAATQLATSVKNLGLAFETPRIEQFISGLARVSGVADDQLRPAMQKLLQTTGSVAKAQELLTQALDISRGSGVDYETVVNDLSMAFVGQTRGLRKYYLGLTQAELKTMSFEDVQKKLTKQFTGANAVYLETYAGKIGILSNASNEATESIGKGLVDALALVSGGGNSIQPLADSMQEFGTWLGDAIYGLGIMIAQIKSLPGGSLLGGIEGQGFLKTYSPLIRALDQFSKMGAAATPLEGRASEHTGRLGYVDPNAAARKKAELDAAKRAKLLADMKKKELDTQKKQNALIKASKILDLDRIGITAALKGKISETDRLSLNLQLALLDKNDTAASKLSAQLEEAVKKHKELTDLLAKTPEAPNPYRNWKPPGFVGPVMPEGVTPPVKNPFGIPYGGEVPNFNVPEYMKQGSVGITGRSANDYLGLGAIGAGATADTIVNVVVKVGEEEITNVITESQVNQSLSGTFSDVSRYNGRGAPSIK
jgi:hypothetical protein